MTVPSMRLGSALLLAAVLLPLHVHAGDCAPRFPHPTIVTADGAAIPPGGGILVEYTTNQKNVTPAAGPVKEWRFVDGKKRTPVKERNLAPGLVVLEPVGTTLENGGGHKLRTFTRAGAGTAPDAPAVKAIEELKSRAGYRIDTYVTVQLAQAVTTDGFLVLVDADNRPRSFGRAQTGSTSVVVYSAGECITNPEGTIPTKPGDSVRVAWVDSMGLMSPVSSAVMVQAPVRAGPVAGP